MAAETIPEPDALALCVIAKTASPAAWGPGAKEGALKCEFGLICDPPRRGLLVAIYINRGHKVKRRTLNFGMWDTSTGGRVRVYQLTVADSASPTHTELGEVWFGSHEHTGAAAKQLCHLDTVNFDVALKKFCESVHLELDEPVIDPLDPDSFSLT